MNTINVIQALLDLEGIPDDMTILSAIIPPKNDTYTFSEIQRELADISATVEEVQYDQNNKFDRILDSKMIGEIQDLSKYLHKIQLDMMKLQCDIALSREHSEMAKTVCDSHVVRERQNILIQEVQLKNSLRRLRFEPINKFFQRLADHLDGLVDDSARLCHISSSNYNHLFDWNLYHQAIKLVATCGQALLDIQFFEKTYRSDYEITGVRYRKPLDQLELDGYIALNDTKSISLPELVTFAGTNETRTLNTITEHSSVITPFDEIVTRLKSIACKCCILVLDLHINYIEAHLTVGINIDKLNGAEDDTASTTQNDVPIYAFSPQDYITQIGQHILTLRKQTEQYNDRGNHLLMYSFDQLRKSQATVMDLSTSQNITELIMKFIARHCIQSLIGRTNPSILNKLSTCGKRQLANDALYLDNVLEDLKLLDANEANVQKFKSFLLL